MHANVIPAVARTPSNKWILEFWPQLQPAKLATCQNGTISSCHTHARPVCFDLCSPQQSWHFISVQQRLLPNGAVLGSCQGAQHLDQQAADLWLPATCLQTHACLLTRPTSALATAFGMLHRPGFPTLDSHLHMPECMASSSRRIANWGYKSPQENPPLLT